MAKASNPFVKADTGEGEERGEEIALHDSLMGSRLIEHGPTSPDALPITADDVKGGTWTFGQVSAVPETRITVMGLHGGAGATTLAELLGPDALDHGQTWPVPPEGERMGVVAVCRSHWRGLEAADNFTTQWAAGLLPGSTLLGLVIVDDGPRLSDGQRRAIRRLLKRTPRGVHVPWVEAWRHASPDSGRIPGRIHRITRALQSAAATL